MLDILVIVIIDGGVYFDRSRGVGKTTFGYI